MKLKKEKMLRMKLKMEKKKKMKKTVIGRKFRHLIVMFFLIVSKLISNQQSSR